MMSLNLIYAFDAHIRLTPDSLELRFQRTVRASCQSGLGKADVGKHRQFTDMSPLLGLSTCKVKCSVRRADFKTSECGTYGLTLSGRTNAWWKTIITFVGS